jgi:integrase
MAKIKFSLQSKNDPANIYLRLSIDKTSSFKRKTGYIINPNSWSKETGLPKQNDANLKRLKTGLQEMANTIEKNLNKAIELKQEISGEWLQDQINTIKGTKKETDPDSLLNWIQHYIDAVPNKVTPGGKTGVTKNTIQKYTTLRNKIANFQLYKKKKYFVKDVGLEFGNELTKYFLEVEKLSRNSTGRYVKYLKAVCNDAKRYDIETHPKLDLIRGISEPGTIVYLTFNELDKIRNTTFTRSALENAKDWLIIGCYIGQRVSDLLTLTNDNIAVRNGLKVIELIQKKTKTRVTIPIHPIVEEILNSKGQFPEPISDQKFNDHIKDICELAGITEPVKGARKINIGTEEKPVWRKKHGIYPKYELITTHVCRRSFASNFYGEMPTALIKSITGHSTEQMFLKYIGKQSNDYAQQIADYWTKQQLKANDKAPMVVLKKAN